VEPRLTKVGVDSLARSLDEAFRAAGGDATLALPPSCPWAVFVDARLLVCAATEACIAVTERQAQQPNPPSGPGTVVLRVTEADSDTIRIELGDFALAREGTGNKTPFAVAGSGVRLALARALSQNAGASLRLELGPDGLAHFTILAPRAPAAS